jgi:phosphate starvation-inducible protein PhoH
VTLDKEDIVRHRLVQSIVEAYEHEHEPIKNRPKEIQDIL